MRTFRYAVLLVLATTIVACASKGPPRPPYYRPVVALQEVKLAGAGLTGGAMDVVLAIHNPNEYSLHSPRVSYRLMIDDVQLASGAFRYDGMVVGARDSATVRLPVSFSYSSLGMSGRAVLDRGTVDYRLLGNLSVHTAHGRYTTSYDRWGRMAPLMVGAPR